MAAGDSVLHGDFSVAEEKTYRWKINNFDEILKKDLVESKWLEFEFIDLNRISSNWRVRFSHGASQIYPNQKAVELHVGLIKKPNSVSEMNAAFAVKLEYSDGTGITFAPSDPNKKQDFTNSIVWTIYELNTASQRPLAVTITITLKTFTRMYSFPTLPKAEIASCDVEICGNQRQQQFYRRISSLVNDEKNSDVMIISGDEQQFYAYRWILSEVSDVFAAMFTSAMKESESGIVKFEDLSGSTVKLLLHFIYTGKLEKEWSMPVVVAEIIYAADKFQLDDLKNYLDANLGSICRIENAANLLALAEKFSMKKAVTDILAFIRETCKDPKGVFEFIKNAKEN